MDQRLKTIPSLYHVDGGVYVATNDKRWWFIVTAECHGKDGKRYPGYLALWRFNRNHPSKEAAIKHAKRWLGMSLV